MSKITLNNVNNLASWTSAGNTIDANSLAVENAVENTLSRDGTSPNEMASDLDMNSNQILNLPYPGSASSPIRLQDAPLFTGPPGPQGPPGLPGSTTTINAANYSGATAGDQITAAMADLPATGGTIDARSLTNTTINGLTISNSGTTILFPTYTFNVTATISITNPAGLSAVVLRGSPPSSTGKGTGFNWTGGAGAPVFLISGARDCEFHDFFVKGTGGTVLESGIEMRTLAGRSMTNNHFFNINMFGNSKGSATGLQKGFRWTVGTGGDANNDVSYLENCFVQIFGNIGYSIEHGQSKTHVFHNCSFLSGVIGVSSIGSFKWYGGSGGDCSDADYVIGAPNDYSTIEGWNSESSNRFIRTGGTSTSGPLYVANCRWAANQLNADNLVINYQFQAGLCVVNNVVGDTANGRSPQFNAANFIGSGAGSGCLAMGNVIVWHPGTAASNPFTTTGAGSGPGVWTTLHNFVQDNDTQNPFRVPDVFSTPIPAIITASTYTVGEVDVELIFNGSGTITITLQDPTCVPGKILNVKTIANHTVVSASSNVVSLDGSTTGTPILAGTAGKWARLISDGVHWNIMQSN